MNAGSGEKRLRDSTLETFVNGPKAMWLFFALYALVTIVLFRGFIFDSDMMLYGSDTIPDGIYTRQYYRNYHKEFGGIPRWNPFILGGLPFIDAMHGDTFYPAAWLKFYMPLHRALGYKLILHVFLAGVFMYAFLRALKLRKDAAFLGGFMYMLAPSFVTWLYGGHDAKMYVIALLPLAVAFLELGMQRARFYLFVCLGAIMGLLILTSQVQMAYYAYWVLGLYFLFRLVFDRSGQSWYIRVKKLVFFVCAVLMAVAIGAVQLLPSYSYSTSQSVRAGDERTSYEYATSFSMHAEETAGMIVPSFPGFTFIDGTGGRDGNSYWGRNPFKLNSEYHGILPIIFGIMALLMCRDRIRWLLAGLAVLSLVYALGADTPFYRLFYSLVPGVKNFRAPGMIIFVFCFAAVVLASLFVSSLLGDGVAMKKGGKSLWYVAGAFVSAAVLLSAAGSRFFDLWQMVFMRTVQARADAFTANMPYFISGLWRVALLIIVSLMGVWMFYTRKIGSAPLVLLLALTALIDCAVVDRLFIKVLDPSTYQAAAPDKTVRELQSALEKSPMPFRILGRFSMNSPNYYAMFGIQAADGFHNNELQTYDMFKGGRSLKNLTALWLDKDYRFNPEGLENNNFLKVAGVKYIVINDGSGRTQLIPNDHAFDRAFIVHDRVLVETDEQAVTMLNDIFFDPARTVIITGTTAENPVSVSGVSAVERFSYVRDGMEIAANMESPGFLVLTENYVPYWSAALDGSPVEIHRAYGTFMTVWCPAGKHEIRFTFRSGPYETGKKATLIALGFVCVSLVVSGIDSLWKSRKEKG